MEVLDTVLATKTLEDLAPVASTPQIDTPQEVDPVVVEQVIELLKEVEKNGGYGDIARSLNFTVTKNQVKEIHMGMITKISELTPIDNPII